MTKQKPKVLIFGYGNPGRQDDGLGVSLAEYIEQWALENSFDHIRTDSNYQLNLEDAATISNYDMVVFADASMENIADFRLDILNPSAAMEFTMHAVPPPFILHLCRQVFNRQPESYILHIKGYEWEFMKEMTPGARKNLNAAIEFVKSFITQKTNFPA